MSLGGSCLSAANHQWTGTDNFSVLGPKHSLCAVKSPHKWLPTQIKGLESGLQVLDLLGFYTINLLELWVEVAHATNQTYVFVIECPMHWLVQHKHSMIEKGSSPACFTRFLVPGHRTLIIQFTNIHIHQVTWVDCWADGAPQLLQERNTCSSSVFHMFGDFLSGICVLWVEGTVNFPGG